MKDVTIIDIFNMELKKSVLLTSSLAIVLAFPYKGIDPRTVKAPNK